MKRGFSLYLDAVRVSAAIVVLLSHFAYGWASGGGLGWIRDLNLGSDAVVLFFVLSGLVISHTTSVKDATLGDYALARLSRLYSVAIPAILLSFACAAASKAMNPSLFANFDAADMFEQALRGLTFTNYVWWDSKRIVANGPYWSVAYEFWYYVLFGAAFYLRGRARLWTLVAVSLFLGPKVLLLAPCWLAGVFVHRLVTQGDLGLSRNRALVFAIAPWLLYAFLLAVNLPDRLTLATANLIGANPNQAFGFSDEFLWNMLLAVMFCTHFLGVASLARNGVSWLDTAAPAIRWVSGRTFSLYLFHMPLLKLGSNVPGYESANPLHATALLAATVVTCLLLAEATERRLPQWREIFVMTGRHFAHVGARLRGRVGQPI